MCFLQNPSGSIRNDILNIFILFFYQYIGHGKEMGLNQNFYLQPEHENQNNSHTHLPACHSSLSGDFLHFIFNKNYY